MPLRNNPYVGSSNVYSSRGLSPSYVNQATSAIPTGLASLVNGILEATTYDPNNDPRATQAALDRVKIRDANGLDAGRLSVANDTADPNISLADIALNAVRKGLPLKEAGNANIYAHMQRDDPSADIGNTLDRPSVLRGEPVSSTMSASTFEARTKPTNILQDGQPVISTAQDAIGQTPVLSDADQKGTLLGKLAATLTHPQQLAAVGAEPRAVVPYTVRKGDGSTEVTDGAGALGAGNALVNATGSMDQLGLTNATKSNVQGTDISLKNFGDILNITRDVAKKDPTLFGVAGEGRRLVQDVTQQVKNAGLVAGGKDMEGLYADVASKAAANGIKLPDVNQFDPNLSNIVKLSHILTYNAAEVFANQQGRSVSDKDVQKFQKVVGDPGNWLSSQQSFLSGLDLMQQLLDTKQKRTDTVLGGKSPAGAPADPAKPPAPAVQTSPTKDIRIDAQGNIIQ